MLSSIKLFLKQPIVVVFIFLHLLLIVLLDKFYALSPDEVGYLFAFNNLYQFPLTTLPQSGSGWITAPTIFLWIAYLPAKVMSLVGIPDSFAIRLQSLIMVTSSMYLVQFAQSKVSNSIRMSKSRLIIVFFIPSVFLWTSTGLRESFIILELIVFLVGISFFRAGKLKIAALTTILASYALVSTKPYLWAILMLSVLITSLIQLCYKLNKRTILQILGCSLVLPSILFMSTTSPYSLNFIFKSDISAVGARSGDSISTVLIQDGENGSTGSTGSTGTQVLTFHGDYTLIALHFYLKDNPKSILSRTLKFFGLDRKIEMIWDEKIALGLISKDKKVGIDQSSLNGHILDPGKLNNPLSILKSALFFVFGPIPLIGDSGLAVSIASIESPIWWLCFGLMVTRIFKVRRQMTFRDSQFTISLIFMGGFILFSALTQVNLGTAFRHRSVLIAPLVLIFINLKNFSIQKDKHDPNIKGKFRS